ncbi:MAG: hypothetical protein HQK86_00770 [Nitrospinae bacterium]|nr:hypothetical protein [Nitrospinota bacterium]MBF0635273.1 hypothetical protein [Nitrospinota bacterium]
MSQKGKLWTAAVTLAVTLLSGALGYWFFGESVFMNGSLSMRHKGIGDDCSACHAPWRGVDDAKCAVCHNATLRHKTDPKGHTAACTQCHREHGGQSASITYVNDTACGSCHKSMTHKKKDPTAKGEFARGGLLLTHSTLLEAKDFQREKCLKCHKNLNFIKGMPTLTSMKGIMSGHLSNVENIKCADCHQPVSLVGFADAVGGGMVYAKCRKCHEKRKVSDSCVYCHRYHHIGHDYKPLV